MSTQTNPQNLPQMKQSTQQVDIVQGQTIPLQPATQTASPPAGGDEVINTLTELLGGIQRLINAIAKCKCDKRDQCEVFLRAQQIVDKYDKILELFEKMRPR